MIFNILTIFPELFDPFIRGSLIKRAQENGLLDIRVHNLRNWVEDKHRTVDDKPFGGGLGMVMKVEPIYKAVSTLKTKTKNKKLKVKVVLFGPRGKKFTQKIANQYSKLDQLIMICGRYEGVDERVAKYIADDEISVGDYVLMGGEVAAMAVIETVARLIPGIVGKDQFLAERLPQNRGYKGFIEYIEYTRPEVFEPRKGTQWKVPKILLSGDHKKIAEWKAKHKKVIQ